MSRAYPLVTDDAVETTFSVERAEGGYVVGAKARLFLADDAEPVDIGRARALYLPHFSHWDDLRDFADADSEDAYELLPAREPKAVRDCASAWLGVLSIEFEPQWRGAGLSFCVMRDLIDLFGSSTETLISCKPHPILREGVDKSQLSAAQKRLQAHWRKFGFASLRGTYSAYCHVTAFRWPAGSWMASRERL